MKKLIITGVLLLGGLCGMTVNADDFCTDWSRFNVCLPVASGVDGAFGYNFKAHQSQGLGETKVGSMKITSTSRAVLKFGGITTEDGKGSPFFGVDYELKEIANPIPTLANIRPGIYGGKNFRDSEWFYGIKASIEVIK